MTVVFRPQGGSHDADHTFDMLRAVIDGVRAIEDELAFFAVGANGLARIGDDQLLSKALRHLRQARQDLASFGETL